MNQSMYMNKSNQIKRNPEGLIPQSWGKKGETFTFFFFFFLCVENFFSYFDYLIDA